MIKERAKKKKAQLTIFIIIGIILALLIIIFFVVRGSLFTTNIPRNMKPAYDSYLSCIEEHTRSAVYLLGSQGGRIDVPDFVSGSSYRPFSSELDFLGQGIPYWMYLSGNNLLKEQVPTKQEMKLELEKYIEERLDFCSFYEYELQGYGFNVDTGDVDVIINDESVEVLAKNSLNIYFENDSIRVNEHKIKLGIRLGKLYDQAKQIYNFEKTDMFLEKYSLDVLRLYTPVDGVEIGCTPLIFQDHEIRQNLTRGLVSNINTLKVKGSYYKLSREENKYFVVDPGFKVDTNVNFMYDPSWPTRVEIFGERVAKPVGLQEGLSILGFCYVPYHLVYDVNFPVLIQLWEDDFFFQFPVSVIIDKNYAREALPPMDASDNKIENEVCKHKNQRIRVYTYDSNYNPIPARVQFKCLNAQCELGQTKFTGGVHYYDGPAPQCINGFVIASSPGYADKKYMVSTNRESTMDINLKKIYKIKLDLGELDANAVITFQGEDYAQTATYPEIKEVELVEGLYNITVYVYKNSSLIIDGVDESICVDVPVDGVGGLFGLTKEKCNDINIPKMEIDSALIGGGKTVEYVFEDTLKRTKEMNIKVPLFKYPKTIEDLQLNYEVLEVAPLSISYE